MLQFNRSLPLNSNAVNPLLPAPAGLNAVILDFTQSYDSSTTPNVVANVINNVGPTTPWVIFQLTGSQVPTASGQYEVDIFAATPATPIGTWGNQATLWAQTVQTWDGNTPFIKNQFIASERAFVSGSNGTDITQYLSPTSSRYFTFNYP
jgi:hypothetical protein